MRVESPANRVSVADRYHRFCIGVLARLPPKVESLIAPTFLGFIVINGFTFCVDLLLLWGLHTGLRLPVPVAVTVAYVCAFALSYVANRTMNFQSHAPVGPQFAIYVAVVSVNYLAFVLGLSSALTVVGVDFRMARILAACCEAVYMYCAMRWLIFRR